MFILSTALPKSGSTLFSWYQREIIEHIYSCSGQEHISQLMKNGSIHGIGHFIENPGNKETLDLLVKISENVGPFVLKSHAPFNETLAKFIQDKKIIATFIHRDPRDIILSAIDHGRRAEASNLTNRYFCQYKSVSQSLPMIKMLVNEQINWITSGMAEIYRYVDLVINPIAALSRFCNSMNMVAECVFLQGVVGKYTSNPVIGEKQFNTGKAERYKNEMTISEIELCTKEIGNEIINLGYAL